jgi:ABC-type proline/glycine betaine transport system ATPase subunit
MVHQSILIYTATIEQSDVQLMYFILVLTLAGINLSGGQRQRIGLARAVYAAVVGDAEMLLLDDPLSAVDAHVGAHIFDQCINGLLRSRHLTVIMPVHNLQFLQRADHVVYLHQTNGTITEQGDYEDLIQAGGEFAKMMETFASVSSKDGEATPASPTRAAELLAAAKAHVGGPTHKAIKRLYHNLKEDPGNVIIKEAIKLAETEEMDGENMKHKVGQDDPGKSDTTKGDKNKQEGTQKTEKKTEKQGKLMTVEERAVGGVDRGVWLYYATTCGLTLSWIVFFCYIGGMGAKVLTDWWMSRWSVDDTSVLIGYEESWTVIDRTVGFLFVYGLLGVFVVVLNGIKTVVVCVIGLKAARTLHSSMLQSLLCAPTSFFDQVRQPTILSTLR